MSRLINNEFMELVYPTIGAAFSRFRVPINEKIVELQIFDCAGHERFNTLLPMYLRGTPVVILVYAVNDVESQAAVLGRWLEFVTSQQVTHVYLVGNKIDLATSTAEFRKQAEDAFRATEIRVKSFLTSAKTGEGISDVFGQIVEDIYISSADPLPSEVVSPPIVLTAPPLVPRRCCW